MRTTIVGFFAGSNSANNRFIATRDTLTQPLVDFVRPAEM